MMTEKKLDTETRAEITELIHEMMWRVDNGQAGTVIELFTEDAALVTPEGRLGIEQIKAVFAKRATETHQSRHMVSNIRLQPVSSERICGTLCFTVFRRAEEGVGPADILVADGKDIYEKGTDGRWRFAEREMGAVFLNPGPNPVPLPG